MWNIATRVGVNALALWVAAKLVDGITLSSSFWTVLLVAAIFGLVNAFLKPIAKVLAFPFVLLTLGLFTLVVNGAMLSITDWLSDGIDVDGFWSAILGAIVISIVSWLLSMFVDDDSD